MIARNWELASVSCLDALCILPGTNLHHIPPEKNKIIPSFGMLPRTQGWPYNSKIAASASNFPTKPLLQSTIYSDVHNKTSPRKNQHVCCIRSQFLVDALSACSRISSDSKGMQNVNVYSRRIYHHCHPTLANCQEANGSLPRAKQGGDSCSLLMEKSSKCMLDVCGRKATVLVYKPTFGW